MQNINISVVEAKAVAFDCMSGAIKYYECKNNHEAIQAAFLAIDNYLGMLIEECKKTKASTVANESNNCYKYEVTSTILET